MARWATFIQRHANPDAAWLIVDAGNFVDRAGTGGCSNKCQFLVSGYRDLHYDVLNIGKQEVWMGYDALKAMLDTVKGTEFICANLVDLKTRRPLAKPTVIRDYGNFRVGLIGLLNEADFPKGNTLIDTTRLAVVPHLEAAKKYVPKLARKTDAVILLCELATPAIDTLVKTVPGIDLVISTGPVRTGEQLSTIGRTRVLGTGSSGYSGHYVNLEFNPLWGDSIGVMPFSAQLDETYEVPGKWLDRVKAFTAMPASSPFLSTPPSVAPSKTVTPVGTEGLSPTNKQGG